MKIERRISVGFFDTDELMKYGKLSRKIKIFTVVGIIFGVITDSRISALRYRIDELERRIKEFKDKEGD